MNFNFDLNAVFNQLADEIAERVAAKLREKDGSDWPGEVEKKEDFGTKFDSVMDEAGKVPSHSAPTEEDEVITPDPEPEDEEVPAITREVLETMELDDAREYAIAQGLTKTQLRGLDVDGIADLLYGEAEEEDEEGTIALAPEDIRDMNIGELKKMAEEIGLDYPRSMSRSDLAEAIIEKLLSQEE